MSTASETSAKAKRLANGAYSVRVRFGQDRSARLQLPAHLTQPQATARAARLSELAKLLWKVPEGNARRILAAGIEADAPTFAKVEDIARQEAAKHAPKPKSHATFRDLGEMWTSGELARRYPDHVKVKRSAIDDKSRLAKLNETIGDVPISQFTKADAKRALAALPPALRSATRRQYGQVICRILKMAVWPLELIDRTPIPPGFLPKPGARPAFGFLYPNEDAALLACADVPLPLRLLYGFLAREGCRLSEALGLRWRDFDLDRGTVTLDRNKTDTPRSWALAEGVAEALVAVRGEAGRDAYVFPQVDVTKAATRFREHLVTAKVDRAELHERTDVRRPIRVHDLRATFITLALAGGRTEAWVQDRTGHTTSQMLNRYRRQARFASELGLGGLVPLAEALGVRQDPCHESEDENAENAKAPDESRAYDGGSTGTRTLDLRIKSPQLYRLSYRPSGGGHYLARRGDATVSGDRGTRRGAELGLVADVFSAARRCNRGRRARGRRGPCPAAPRAAPRGPS